MQIFKLASFVAISSFLVVACGDDDTGVGDDTTSSSSSSGGTNTTSSSSSGGASSGGTSSSSSGGSSSGGASSSSSSSGGASSSSSGGPAATYPIRVHVTGLQGTGLVLQNNGGDNLTVDADGDPAFGTELADGASYKVSVLTQPSDPSQHCDVSGAEGQVMGAAVATITVDCATNKFTVGGTISGLAGSGLKLKNNGLELLDVTQNGDFAFHDSLDDHASYNVEVSQQPTSKSQLCRVTLGTGQGQVDGENVSTVAVTCETNTFPVRVAVSGLADGEALTVSNGIDADDIDVDANGTVTFDTEVADGEDYAVTLGAAPAGKLCDFVGASSGTIDGAPASVTVACATPVSCLAWKAALGAAAADGDYQVDVDGEGAKEALTVHCDMTTDGGGYLSYKVTGGTPSFKSTDPDSCQDLGLHLAVARTQAHLDALYLTHGAGSFLTVPGVSKATSGDDPVVGGEHKYTQCAMNSDDLVCGASWKAIDGGKWFARSMPYSEPNGDYTENCWLNNTNKDASGLVFNDLNCNYSTGTTYVCSDNKKP